MAANLVKFVYAASATPQQIAAFDSNTIYFIGNTHQIYKGTTLYDGGSSDVAAELTTLEGYIGTLPVSGEYDDLIDYIDKSIAAGDTTVTGLVTTLEDSLADIATSGAAADASIADIAGNFTATNVEDALAELHTAIGTGGTNAAVTITKTAGGANDTYAYRYVFSQGGNAITNGTIDIAKDMVATDGTLVHPTAQNPITIGGQQVTSGAYIAMTIANGDTFYINVADLIEYNSVSSTDEITLTDTNHTITATVGEIAASKIIYQAAEGQTPAKTVAQAINALESAVGTGGSVDTKISNAIAALDADVDATAGSVITGITEVDGVITHIDEVALTAQNVAYGNSTVKAALDTIGTIPGTSSALTVIGYVDEKVGAGVTALDADVDAVLGAGDTDAEAVAVVTGVTEVDGIITGVDSVAADKAGAATRAKAEVIGTNSDAASANTIYGAKAYANAAVAALDADVDAATDTTVTDAEKVAVVTGVTEVDGVITAVDSVDVDLAGAATRAKNAVIGSASDAATAATIYGAKAYADSIVSGGLAALDADLDATGTAQHAGVFVVSGVTQVDGAVTAVDSTEVEVAGAAAAAEQAAKSYTDAALTWGSLA
jgi:hypothetical protein